MTPTFNLARGSGIGARLWIGVAAFALLMAQVLLLLRSCGSPLVAIGLLALDVCLILFFVVVERPVVLGYLLLLTGGVPLEVLTSDDRPLLGSLGGLNVSSMRLVFVVAVLVGYIAWSKRTRSLLLKFKVYLLFLGLAAISLAYTPDRFEGIRFLAKLAYPFLICVFLLSIVRRPQEWYAARSAIWWSLLATLVFAVIYVPIGGSLIYYSRGIPRLTLSAQSILSFYAGILCLASGVHFFWIRKKVFLWLFILLAMVAFFTLTRITIVALGVGILALAYYRTKSLFLVGLVLVLGSIGVLMYQPLWDYMFYDPVSPSQVLGDLANGNWSSVLGNLNTTGRSNAWPQLIQDLYLEHPILGDGLGSSSFFLRTAAIVPGKDVLWGEAVSGFGYPHNEYIRFLCDMGIVGFVLFLLTYREMWRTARRIFKLPISRDVQAAGLTAALCTLFLMITALTDNSFNYYAPFTGYVWAWFALAVRGSDLFPVGPSKVDEDPALP